MEDYQQRVIDEKTELDEKIVKLEAFLDRDPTLDFNELARLEQQWEAMKDYSQILGLRIEAF